MNRNRARALRIVASAMLALFTLNSLSTAAATVTGIELAVEGSPTAVSGGVLRWFFTLYEIDSHNRLTTARSGRLRITTDLRPDDTEEISVDAHGRAEVEIPIPEDVAELEVAVDAEAAGLRRNFTLSISAAPLGDTAVIADRTSVQPGERVTFIGRAVDGPWGRALANRSVSLSITDQDGRRIGPEKSVTTSAAGTFRVSVVAPMNAKLVRCNAIGVDVVPASTEVTVSKKRPQQMTITAVPERRIVRPGAKVPVEVTVQRKDGRPVRGAEIEVDGTAVSEDETEQWTTDENGRLKFTWTAPRRDASDIEDQQKSITVNRPGIGSRSAEISVRTARTPYQTDVYVEGGGLLTNLPSRLYVSVTRADGTPARKVAVNLDNPLLGTLHGTTDNDGVARFKGRPALRPGVESRDRCGGITASSVTLQLSADTKSASLEEATYEHCVPVDPDGTVRVRTGSVSLHPGDIAAIELFMSKSAERLPVEVALLWVDNTRAENPLIPISRSVVETPGRHRKTSVKIPADITGEILVRARPLVGPSRIPVRGGTARIVSRFGTPITASLRVSGSDDTRAHLVVSETGSPTASTLLLVPTDDAEALTQQLSIAMQPPLFQNLGTGTEASPRLLEALLAARTRRDDAAPAVLRKGVPVGMPGVDDPTRWGILRDPIRARARFVSGRLALSIRTLEERLDQASPKQIREVGIVGLGERRFNREALTAVKSSGYLAGRDPMTLGGEPLSLEDLEQMDRSFTFDNMARRITRKRLLSLLIHLRSFVRNQNLDLGATGRDPTQWIDALAGPLENFNENNDLYYGTDFALDFRMLFDGWGRKMAVVKTTHPRSRTKFISPLPAGYALVSAGPDGRFNTADDLLDPFARVLPTGSMYAEAVGEDALLLRLSRIEIDRAVVDALVPLFVNTDSDDVDEWPARGGDDESETVAPKIRPLPTIARRFERSWIPVRAGSRRSSAPNAYDISVDGEPRRWSLIGVAWSADGRAAVARKDFEGGFPLIVDVEPLHRLSPHEPLVVPVTGAVLPGGPTNALLSVESDGVVQAAFEDGRTETALAVGPGGGFEARVRIVAVREGNGVVRIVARSPGSSRSRTVSLTIDARKPGSLRTQHASAGISKASTLRLEIPNDATEISAAAYLALPTAFLDDPTLSRWIDKDPALVAWALAISGTAPQGRLLRGLESVSRRNGMARGELPLLSTACAAAAWSAVDTPNSRLAEASRNGIQRSKNNDDRNRLAEDAAVLAALSLAVTDDDTSRLSEDLADIRTDLRAAVRQYRDDPAFLARGAAALLLADRRDLLGKTMAALAATHLRSGYRGGKTVELPIHDDVSSDELAKRDDAEALIATAALAVAAHQSGDDHLASELARGLAAGADQATRVGGEVLFWWLAARAFGVFGMLAPETAATFTVSTNDGPPRQITLSSACTPLPIKTLAPEDSVEIRVAPKGKTDVIPLLHTEASYVRPAAYQVLGPLEAALSGDPGFAGERAAFMVTVTNTGGTLRHPTVLLYPTAGAELDAEAVSAILKGGSVAAVAPPDARGAIRIRLRPLDSKQSVTLPLPLHWTAAGPRTGAAMALFPEDRDWELTVVPAIEINVPFRP